MKRVLTTSSSGFLRPLVAIAGAIVVVLAVGTIAQFLLSRQSTTNSVTDMSVERVMVGRPTLAITPPRSALPKYVQSTISNSAGAPAGNLPNTQIARVGAITLLVPNVDRAIAAVSGLTRAQSGDVLSLDDQSAAQTGSHATAQIEIRVPESRFNQALDALGQVGSPRARSITAEDLATQIVDSSARLRNLRRTERDIQGIMDRSGSVSQILDAENQLSSVREQIETLDADVKSMQTRVRYSTISVSLEAEGSAPAVEAGARAQIGSAWREATHALWQLTVGLIGAMIWLVVFVPYVAVAGLVAQFGMLLRKRRRVSRGQIV